MSATSVPYAVRPAILERTFSARECKPGLWRAPAVSRSVAVINARPIRSAEGFAHFVHGGEAAWKRDLVCQRGPGFVWMRCVSRTLAFLKYWLPVIVWMGVIFSASTDGLSSRRTSRIIGPVLRWLVPDIAEETIYRVQYAVRKGGHLTEYAVLAWLAWRARRRPVKNDPRPLDVRATVFALAVAAAYAVTDEVHQSFVPSREGRVADVLLDTAGAALGLTVLWGYIRWRRAS